MNSIIQVPISTNNLNLINKICRTKYTFDDLTDLELLTFTKSKLYGIHALAANNFILLVQNAQKYFPLPYMANETLIKPLEGELDCEYLTFELGIFYSENLGDILADSLEDMFNTMEADIRFTKTKVGRTPSK